jgi:hypothetical protein
MNTDELIQELRALIQKAQATRREAKAILDYCQERREERAPRGGGCGPANGVALRPSKDWRGLFVARSLPCRLLK